MALWLLRRVPSPHPAFQSGANNDQSVLTTGSNLVRFYCRNAVPGDVGRGCPLQIAAGGTLCLPAILDRRKNWVLGPLSRAQ